MGNSHATATPPTSDTEDTRLQMKTPASEDVPEGQPLRKRNVQWFDASDEIPIPFSPSSAVEIRTKCVSKEEAEAFWNEGVPPRFWNEENRTPTKPSWNPNFLQSIGDSRSPTSRFLNSRKVIIGSPMRRFHPTNPRSSSSTPIKKTLIEMEDDTDEEISDEEREEVDGCSMSRPDEVPSTPTRCVTFATPLTDSAEKRKKKREKKKARQANKENLIKKQKAQRAEEEKIYEQKMLTHKRALARYAAAVAKPTIREGAETQKTCVCCGEVEHSVPLSLKAATTKLSSQICTSSSFENTKEGPPVNLEIVATPSVQPESPIPSPAPFIVGSSPPTFNLVSVGTSSLPVSPIPISSPQISEVSIYFTPPSEKFVDKATSQVSETTSSGISSSSTTPESLKFSSPRKFGPARDLTPPRKAIPRTRKDTPLTSKLTASVGEPVSVETEVEEVLGKDPQIEEVFADEIVLEDELKQQAPIEAVSEKRIPIQVVPKKVGKRNVAVEKVRKMESEEFEVLVLGQRRKVKSFTPRKKLTSTTGDEPEATGATSSTSFLYDEMPEVQRMTSDVAPQDHQQPFPFVQPPVFVPMSSLPPQHIPPPRYVQMPMQFPPQRPPVIIQQPIFSSYGPVPSRYPYGPPRPPFPQMVQMAPQGIPMQVMVNRPMYLHQQPQPGGPPHHPAPRMPIAAAAPPPRYPPVPPRVQRPLRAPLPITAPPSPLSIIPPIQEDQEVQEEPPKTPKEELQLKVQEDVPEAVPEAVSGDTREVEDLIEKMVLEDIQKNSKGSGKERVQQSSSPELNSQLIVAGINTIFDGPEDEVQPTSSSVVLPPSSATQEAINRVCIFAKEYASKEFEIWNGFMTEMPPRPDAVWMKPKYQKMWEEDDAEGENSSEDDVPKGIQLMELNTEDPPTLVSICKSLESYFMNTRSFWLNRTDRVDGNHLAKIFKGAYSGYIPPNHWKILEKVCQFKPGYIHVFHALVGESLEFNYFHEVNPEDEDEIDPLLAYVKPQSKTQIDVAEIFYTKFENLFLSEILRYLPDRLISIRVFVAIVEVIRPDCLTFSDLHFLSLLIYGTRDYFKQLGIRFQNLQVIETAGKRWVRRKPEIVPSTVIGDSRMVKCNRVCGIEDFMVKLQAHIEDVLTILPNTVISDVDFIKATKLVCGWRGDHEERIWYVLAKDRMKFKKFYDHFEKYIRIEIRMGTMYLQKQNPHDENNEEEEEVHIRVPATKNLRSILKFEMSEEKKSVSFASPRALTSYELRPSEQLLSPFEKCTQTGNLELEKVWDVERELIRHLKKNNVTFEQFIQTTDAQEMYQFLVDFFKMADHQYIVYVLEKAITEIRENSWEETVKLREAAEEAQRQLDDARVQHLREFGDMQQRMETISRFETFEVQVESFGRIDELKARIRELEKERNEMVKQEVEEERLSMERVIRDLEKEHAEERLKLNSEIARLREVNRHILTVEDVERELQHMNKEREEAATRWSAELNKARSICEHTSRLLKDSQQEIEILRRQNQELMAANSASSVLSRNQLTPDPEPESSADSSPGPISPPITCDARCQLKVMEKMLIELDPLLLIEEARNVLQQYTESGSTNCKERKTAKKQLRDFEQALEDHQKMLEENIKLLKRGVSEGLVPIPEIPQPFSEKVLQTVYESQQGGSDLSGMGDCPTTSQTPCQVQKEEEEDGCLICHEQMPDEWDTISCETCSKSYHYECISKWLSINSVCPACFRALKDPHEFPSLG